MTNPTSPAAVRDDVATMLLGRRRIRIAILLPVVAGLSYVVVVGDVVNVPVVVGTAALFVVLAGIGALSRFPGDPATDVGAGRLGTAWQASAVIAGVGATIPFFHAVEIDVEVMAGVYGIALVLGTFVFMSRLRWWLQAWIVTVWFVVLAMHGVSDPVVLSAHAAGAALLLTVAVLQSRRLEGAVGEARRARQLAEQRASLLASLLRTNTLHPQAVLDATARGLVDVGFDGSAIRALDHDARLARLVAGVAPPDGHLVEEIPFDESTFDDVIADRRPVRLPVAERMRMFPENRRYHDVVVMPLSSVDGEVRATVSAAMLDTEIDEAQLEAAWLLAGQAGQAFTRARSYADDERIVAELQRLELRTREFVTDISHQLRTPLTVVRGLGTTLRDRWDELDPDEAEELVTRMRQSADRLVEVVRSLSGPAAFAVGPIELDLGSLPLRRGIEERVVGRGGDAGDGSIRIVVHVAADVEVRVDRVLFGYLVDEVIAHVAGSRPTGTDVEVTARLDGDRISVAFTDAGEVDGDEGDAEDAVSGPDAGLGLSLAQEIVRAHGGRMVVAAGEVRFDVPAA